MRGKCLCGEVQFEIDIKKLAVVQCHCSLCRKQGGSASNSATFVPQESFRWLSGEMEISKWQSASGFRSEFCRNCGSPVPNPLKTSDLVWIPVGLIDGEADLQVVTHIYTNSMASWDPSQLTGACFEEMPGLETMVSLMHSREDT